MASHPLSPSDVALIGAGRVGTAVAQLLRDRGHRILGVASRSERSARRAAERLGSRVFDIDRPVDADVYLLGTGIDPLPELASTLAAHVGLEGRFVVHFAGAAGITPLADAGAAGAAVCALHPVQSCPDVDAAVRNLPGSFWGVTVSPGHESWVERFVDTLDGTVVLVDEEDRVRWHAAAVVTSNGLAALLAAGESILRDLGVADPERVLGPLAAGTLANARTGGGGARTLTGPVVRGETDVVHAHLASLIARSPRLSETYRTVSSLIVEVAALEGRIDGETARSVREALEIPA